MSDYGGVDMRMTGRERVLTALNHRQPDGCPVSFGSSIVDGMTGAFKRKFDAYMGYAPAEVQTRHHIMGMVETPPQITEWINPDIATVWPMSPWVYKGKAAKDGSYTDAYGCLVRPVSFYYDAVQRPLIGPISADDIRNHPWPNPYATDITQGLLQQAEAAQKTGRAVLLDIPAAGPFEGACWVRGFEDFLCDLYEDEYLAETLMDAITENTIGYWDTLLSKTGHLIDICGQGDDIGMQDRPFISTEIYEKLIKKYHKRIYDFIKAKTKAKIFMHVCGSVYDLLPALIETGVDILEAVQTSAANMEPARLKKDFGDALCFWGAVDTQQLIMNATPEEFKAEIFRLAEILGENGGYILAPSHNIQPNVPCENIQAMLEAFNEIRGLQVVTLELPLDVSI